jgi:hypothetical protein
MCAVIAPTQSEIALVETDAPEFFVSGLARVETLGANARLVCFGDYMYERRVNLAVIMPIDAIGAATELIVMTLGAGLIAPARPVARKWTS